MSNLNVTCIDPRTDPAQFLGLGFADAIVGRTVGGRVTDAVIQDLSYIGCLVQQKAAEGPYFEAAVIHTPTAAAGCLKIPHCGTGSPRAPVTTSGCWPPSRRRATLVIATIRGLLLDLLTTGDTERVRDAADSFLASLESATG